MSNHLLSQSHSPGSPPPVPPPPGLMNELLASIGAANGGRLSPSTMALMSSQLQMQQLFQSHLLSPNQLQSLIQQQLLHHNKDAEAHRPRYPAMAPVVVRWTVGQ
ncbi:unnamed protein product [Oppiella nova]|uniref:Uncharacterized protein n=1 Tax=Oppiella nova TaxID=334625 RepID=A0A7R9LEI4_9ACAR|nr:unnamed protein product [Oppiella nova]CAG2162336.1 unnamed protein product [Oppiella nova]